MTKQFDSFQEAYLNTLKDIVDNGIETVVDSKKVKEIMPYDIVITNPRNRLLNIPCRKNIYPYVFGELLWYLSGSDMTAFISKYAKYWDVISDDGIHSNSAYGKYIFGEMPVKGFGVQYDAYDKNNKRVMSQWEFCKNLLKEDPTTRRAIIHIKPVQMYNTLDTVCTLFMHFVARDNKLDLHVNMRSNDIVRGTTYDVFMFTFLQEMMAQELGLELGTYYHHVTNIHLYEKDYVLAKQILKEMTSEKRKEKELSQISPNFRDIELPSLLKIEKELRKLSPLGKELLLMYLKGDIYCE